MKILMRETVRRNIDGKRYSAGNTYVVGPKVGEKLIESGHALEVVELPVSAFTGPRLKLRQERTPEQRKEAARKRAETIARKKAEAGN